MQNLFCMEKTRKSREKKENSTGRPMGWGENILLRASLFL